MSNAGYAATGSHHALNKKKDQDNPQHNPVDHEGQHADLFHDLQKTVDGEQRAECGQEQREQKMSRVNAAGRPGQLQRLVAAV